MKLTKIEKVLWNNDLEKMLNNHIQDAEDLKEHQLNYNNAKSVYYYDGKIAGLKQALKLLKINKIK